MSASKEFHQSWSRLTEQDLCGINVVFANNHLRTISSDVAAYLGGRLLAEVRHRQDLAAIPEHELPWNVVDNGALHRCYLAALAIRRAASCQSETLAEWGDLLMDSVCSEMARRLKESQQMAEQMIQEGN